jgi:hypothetical protein
MRGFLHSTGGRLTLVTLLLAVLASPLQPMIDFAAAGHAADTGCGLLVAIDENLAGAC